MDRNNEYRISLTSVSGLDGDELRDDKVLSGKYSAVSGGYVISYTDVTGTEETKTLIKVRTEEEPLSVYVKRKGYIDSLMHFSLGEPTEFLYKIPMGALPFTLVTEDIIIEEAEKTFTLDLKYSLYSGTKVTEDGKVSENRLRICIFL